MFFWEGEGIFFFSSFGHFSESNELLSSHRLVLELTPGKKGAGKMGTNSSDGRPGGVGPPPVVQNHQFSASCFKKSYPYNMKESE